MNTQNFTNINLALNLLAAVVLLAIAFTWGAPALMSPSYPQAEMARLCAQTKGCRKVAVTSQWNPAKSRYQPVVEVFFNSMSDQDRNNLVTEVRRAFDAAASRNPIFGYRYRNIVVLFNYAK